MSLNVAALRHEFAAVRRFILVGLVNTGIGYTIILGALALGAHDYTANVIGYALGLPISYALHRRLTFKARHKAHLGELIRYGLAMGLAFAGNLAVVAAGRALGFTENPLVQALAICTYAGLFFILARLIVFRGSAPELSRESSASPR